MNSKNHKSARSAAKHSGTKGKRFVCSRAGVDWMFRRLKHQALLTFAKGDGDRKRLATQFAQVSTYHSFRALAKRLAGGAAKWDRFLDRFYAHKIMRQA